MAGPCGIETREQAFAVAERVSKAGARFFRGGAYKPRTSPYAFQGLGVEGLKILAEIRDQFGLLIATEAIDHETLDHVEEYADIIQIGARNMQNFSLLKRAGRAKKPVLLKRGMSATLEELLMAAEYIMSEGNYNVDPLRARRAYLCRSHPQHARPQHRSCGTAPQPFAHHRRSQPWHRQTQQSHSALARSHCRRRKWTDGGSALPSGPGAL